MKLNLKEQHAQEVEEFVTEHEGAAAELATKVYMAGYKRAWIAAGLCLLTTPLIHSGCEKLRAAFKNKTK